MRISPPEPRRFYERLRDQLSLGACARLFGEAIAPYGFEAFACGEVDLADRDRTVTHLAQWPPDCEPCYFECAFVPRDPVISALGLFRTAFAFGELAGDPRFAHLDPDVIAAAATHGWTQGLVVPVTSGGIRFGLVSLVGRGAPVEGFLKASLCLISGRLFTHARALVGAAEAAEDLSVREYERADRSAWRLGRQKPDAALASA